MIIYDSENLKKKQKEANKSPKEEKITNLFLFLSILLKNNALILIELIFIVLKYFIC